MNRALLNANIKVSLVKLLQGNHQNVQDTEDMGLTERQTSLININLVEVQLADIRKETEEAFKNKY